jgi:4-hydroxy-3-methylbut-2-enyl diphosphate reductase
LGRELSDVEVIVAKTAGFCFGVKRAVDQVYRQIDEGVKPIYTYGPIIHNEEVVRELSDKGVRIIDNEEELSKITEGTVIIRSHGVAKRVYDLLERPGLHVVDATCPFVKKIHRIVNQHSKDGADVVIIGNEGHPEVEGIKGWCCNHVTVIGTEADAENFRHNGENPLCIVSQTTFNYKKFNKLVEIISKMRYDNVDVLNTICSATEERQSEAREIAARVDSMIVIGGRHSSNTRKLFEICQKECANTYYIQTLRDLDLRQLPSTGCVGITAGASTPKNLIEEVSNQCLI